jgi:hypothetical protein
LPDTVASTIDDAPANVALHFSIHAMAIDRSGTATTRTPPNGDRGMTRLPFASPYDPITDEPIAGQPMTRPRVLSCRLPGAETGDE